jgi:flagellar protein FlbD
MIQLTRLNNQPLVVNSDLIKFLEHSPDTVLTLVTGEKLVVRETPQEVLQKVVTFRQSILIGLPAEMRDERATGLSANPSQFTAAAERKL